MNKKIRLKNVTLLGIDCVNIERLQAAIDLCQEDFEFAQVKILSSLKSEDKNVLRIKEIASLEEYSKFIISELVNYIDTPYVLVVQYDGFILNPEQWTDEFLNYDYIGAPWHVADWSIRDFDFPKDSLGKKIVGNGGFSLRSKKFLEISARLFNEGKIPKPHPEDVAVCVWYREHFEKEGIKFAPVELAERFSVEGEDSVYKNQFGFHGFGWTNIDAWVNSHPKYGLIVNEYKEARIAREERLRLRGKVAN
jgi:hypothetical protein